MRYHKRTRSMGRGMGSNLAGLVLGVTATGILQSSSNPTARAIAPLPVLGATMRFLPKRI